MVTTANKTRLQSEMQYKCALRSQRRLLHFKESEKTRKELVKRLPKIRELMETG